MNFYEVSLRALVPEDRWKELLGESIGVDLARIGTETEYWERLNTPEPLVVGVTVQSADKGYRTFVKWVQSVELAPSSFLTLASGAAREFATDVAIPNVVDPTDFAVGRYLVVSPDGPTRQAFEVRNSDVFELEELAAANHLETNGPRRDFGSHESASERQSR